MFQKSLQILIGCALLTLATIVGYSALRLHGPEDTLAEARNKYAAGFYGEVIADLNLAEHGASFTQSPDLTKQLWRLRYEAQAMLDNPRGALTDLQRLLSTVEDDEEDEALRLDEIRLLARAGDGEFARRRGRTFLAQTPEHSRALELTGEACQTMYQPLLGELQVRLERDLGTTRRATARTALLAYVYRPEGDDEIQRSVRTLEQMYVNEAQLVASWPEVLARAREVRDLVQEGLGYFQRSLDLGGEPVAAFRAVATAYKQSGRIDDLLIACEIQRRVFDHDYVNESGALAAWSRIDQGLPFAALATVDRWLPEAEIDQRGLDGTLGTNNEQLALARALASAQTGLTQELWKTNALIRELRENGVEAYAAQWLNNAQRLTITDKKDPAIREKNLNNLLRAAMRQPAPLDRTDLVAALAPMLLQSLLERDASDTEVLTALQSWQIGRPESVEPHFRKALYLRGLGRTAAALAAIADAATVSPDDPRLLPLRVAVSREHYENTSQSGLNLLEQCAQSAATVPDAADPIGFVLCAEAALAAQAPAAYAIALNCARAASGAFPKANIPRQLELRALMSAGLIAEAAVTADKTLQAVTPDAETLRLAIQAKRMAGQTLRELVRMAAPRIPDSRELRVELLRIALQDAPATAVTFLTDEMTTTDASAEERALAIRALVANDDLGAARRLLTAPAQPLDAPDQETMLGAFSAWLSAACAQTPDAQLVVDAPQLYAALGLEEGAQQALFAALPDMVDTHPRTAFALLERALVVASPDERGGRLYALAGDLALQTGDLVRAETRWLAAISFADGAFAAERLARLLLMQGQSARAEKVYSLVDSMTDPALGARMGRTVEAAALLAQQLQQDPTELLIHATLATFGQPTMVDWTATTDPSVLQQRLELLSGLREPHLASLTLQRANDVLANDPTKQTSYLLLARASSDAGLAPAAAALHTELFNAGLLNPVLLREVARAGRDPLYVPSEVADAWLIESVTKAGFGDSPETFAYATERIVKRFEAGGFSDMARETRLSQWFATPQLRPWRDEDLALITAGHPPARACFIIDQILRGPHARAPEQLLHAFYSLAPAAVEAAPKSAKTLTAMARGQLRREGAFGQIVHFLLQNAGDDPELDRADLLTAHMNWIAMGRDDRSLLEATAEQLVLAVGVAEATRRVEEILDAHPASVVMWSLRARLATRQMRDADTLNGIRNVLNHAKDPEAELSFLGLAAAEHELADVDVERFARLPKTLTAGPAGKYVEALFALRRGQPEEAAALFAVSEPQPNGRHLYLWALAELMRPGDEAMARARDLLQRLLRDYPNSSLARNAGSFVRQLTPR